MSELDHRDEDVVTHEDLRHELFDHCGDEELFVLQCPSCEQVFVYCGGCESVIPSLVRPDLVDGVQRTRAGLFVCPGCAEPFAEADFLDDGIREEYEVSHREFVRRGFGRLLV